VISQYSDEYVVKKVVNALLDTIIASEETVGHQENPNVNDNSEIESEQVSQTTLNASYTKIRSHPVIEGELETTTQRCKKQEFKKGYHIIDMNILEESASKLACSQCFNTKCIKYETIGKQGLAHLIKMKCIVLM